tara:strand:- start:1065 stop:2504 length:1440 start_codon:yes stop_codon:yes gene_type:complete
MIDISFYLPELILLISLSFIILFDLFLPDDKKEVSYYLVQVSLILCSYFLYSNLDIVYSNDVTIYDNSLFSIIFKLFIVASLILIFHYSYIFLSHFKKYQTEYFSIILFGLLGIMIMISAKHLLLLYLGIELLSLSLYSIIAFNKDSIYSSEAAIKYFILGAISSGFLLFGISLIYGLTGYLDYQNITAVIQGLNLSATEYSIHSLGLVFALTFILISLAFKFGAAPFHMWIPDVYQGSMTPTTLLLSTLPKIAIFTIILSLTSSIFRDLLSFWTDILLTLSIISIIIGNVVALVQTNIKRMLAYSTIANVGFILVGMYSGSQFGYQASLFYTVTYVLFTIAIFGIITQIKYNNKPVEEIKDLSGLNLSHPVYALMILIIMLSLIGIPPLLGFHAKLFIIQSLVITNEIGLAIFVVLMTVIGSFYYLRVIKVMYFDNQKGITELISSKWITYYLLIFLVLLGLNPEALANLTLFALSNL